MEKTVRRGNGKRSLESTDLSPACDKKRRESKGPDESDYIIGIKEEIDTDDPLYVSPLDDPHIKNEIEDFEEEDSVIQSQLDSGENETSSPTNLLPYGLKKEYKGGSQTFTSEDTSRTNLVAAENATSSPKNEHGPKLVVYPLMTDGSLQVESVTSGNKNVTNKANTEVRILNARKPVTRAVRRTPQSLQAAASASEEEEDDEEEFEHLLEKKTRVRRKKQRSVESWNSSSSLMKTLKFTRSKSWLMPRTTQPADYFKYFFDDNYLKELVDATNQDALSKKNSRFEIVHLRGWTNVTVSEMKIFLGLLLHTGTAKMTHLGDYWRQHRLFKSCFRDYMTPQRFTLIMRYLTIPNCTAECEGISERFNSVMNRIYYPARNLNLDITILDWSLKSMYVQYQSWMDKANLTRITTLREQDGMIIHIVIGTTLRKAPDLGTSLLKMLNGKLDGGHSLNVSNAIAMTPLVAGRLLDRNTYCTAVNIERIPVPLQADEIEPGQNRSVFHQGVHVGKYNSGSANIYYLSTEFKDDMKQSKSSQFTEPVAVSSHEERQKTIERFDLFEYYPCEVHKLVRIKRIFVHCLMLSLMNANLLYNAFSGTNLNFFNYRLKVIEHLLPEIDVGDAEVRVKPTQAMDVNTPPVERPRESLPTNSSRGTPHKISKIPKSTTRVSEDGKVVKATSRRLCRNCKNVRDVKRNSIYECTGCKGSPALCLDCFFEIHNVTV